MILGEKIYFEQKVSKLFFKTCLLMSKSPILNVFLPIYKNYFPHPCYGKNMMMDKKLSMIEFPFFQMNFIPKNVVRDICI